MSANSTRVVTMRVPHVGAKNNKNWAEERLWSFPCFPVLPKFGAWHLFLMKQPDSGPAPRLNKLLRSVILEGRGRYGQYSCRQGGRCVRASSVWIQHAVSMITTAMFHIDNITAPVAVTH